ncbi:MAG: hypothetical protein ABI151_11685, partial [Chitinophagaceae bacterium]
MVIKPAGKIALIILFIVLAFFTYRYFVPAKPGEAGAETTSGTMPQPKTGEEMGRTGTSSGNGSGNTDSKSSSSKPSTGSRSFSYIPEKPVNGTLRGVVEVGASGFNSFVINMDQEKRWEIVSKDFGESLAYEGLM